MMSPRDQPEGAPRGTDAQELFLMRLRYKEGRISELGANKPFLIDDPAVVWVIYSGQVDLFCVRVDHGQAVGTRHHLLRVPAGEALFGLDLTSPQGAYGLLAVANVGTRVIKVPRSRFQEFVQAPLQAQGVAVLIERWIAGLSLAIAQGIPPKDCQLLEPGEEAKLLPKAAARAHYGVLWVRHLEGQSLFMGQKDWAPLSADGFFPVTKDTWFEAVDETRLEPVDTSGLLEKDPGWSSLDRFHAAAVSAMTQVTERSIQTEGRLLRMRRNMDRAALNSSLSQLASVLPARRAPPPTDEDGDPLLVACRWVGRARGITIHPHPAVGKRPQRDPLGDIAKASRVKIRQVMLTGSWWQHESGPLLGSLSDTERPVALLPVSGRRYEMWDPVEGKKTPVTRAVADQLAPSGYSFYPPLEDGLLSIRDLIKFGLRECAGDLDLVLLMGTCTGLLALVTPFATGLLIDTIIPNADRSQLLQVALALIAAALATALFNITQAIAVLRVQAKMDSSLQAAIWDRLMNLPVPFFRQYTAGDLAARALGVSTIRQILTGVTLNSILSAVFSLFSLALMLWYNITLTLVGLGLVAIILLIASWATYIQMRKQRELADLKGAISGLVLQLITGVSKLRVANAERRAFALWAKDFAAQKKVAFWTRSVSNATAVFTAIAPIATLGVIFYSIFVSPDWHITAGSFVGFNSAFSQFLTAMLGMSTALMTSLTIVPIYDRMKPILENLPEVDEAKADPGDLSGAIEVSHICFRYVPDGPLILDDVSLYAKPGEFVAVVGPSGSGKSTLFRMLLGFEKPESGAINYDDQDLACLDIQAVRRQLGVVLQNAKLMTGDIFTNIIGSSRMTIDDAWEAARMVGLDEDIRQMPMGMYTVIMEGGANFSGGQRQRLLIARAIVTKPRILLFDEATSALDNLTQRKVSQSLESLQATRVVIAHRLSTIINADRIYVLIAGKVAQTGTYQELLNQRGPFADLVRRQLA